MWPLLVACAAPPEPVEVVPPPAPTPPPPLELVGRASFEGLDTPPLPDGAALLGPDCATLNARLHGDGPPCFVEDWAPGGTAGADTVRVERAGRHLRFDGVPGRVRWTPISGTLDACLGDPFALPPAGDPGGVRALDKRTWVLTLSGANRCALQGTLRLDATLDRADWSGIRAGGLPWSAGGREAAQAVVHAEILQKLR